VDSQPGTAQSGTVPSGTAAGTGPLAGVRVADFGQYVAGPLAGMLLADLGADVARVDPPGGPRWDTPAGAVWNRGKQSVVLDLRQPADLDVARRLAGAADVLLENFRPGVMDRLGLGAGAVMAANPGVVYCSMPGFAADDPRADVPGWEGVVSAAAAAYSRQAPPGSPPVFSAVPIASAFAAFLAATGVTAALRARRRLGRGQRLEVPLFDAMFVALGYRAGSLGRGAGTDVGTARLLGLFPCADQRWIFFHTGSKRAAAFLAAAGAGDWLDEPDARDRLAALFATRPARAWEDLGDAEGAEVAMLRTSAEWLREPHARQGGLAVEVDDPRYGLMLQPGPAVTLSAAPARVRFPARQAGADREAVLAGLAAAGAARAGTARVAQTAAAAETGADETGAAEGPAAQAAGAGGGALAGVRVVDLAIVLAGPTCGRTLAELGADVIRVDIPAGRARRGLGPAGAASAVGRAFSIDVNRGKRSIVLDLKDDGDRDVLWALIDQADVLVENFRGGVIDALGFGYAAVRARRPGIVYASLNTYGYAGPWRDRPGHEQLAQTVSGMAERYGGDGPPVLQNVGALDDYGTGVLGACAVIAALLHRDRTGEGQRVTAALAATAGLLQSAFCYDYPGRSWDEPRGQDARGWGPGQRLYAAAGGTWLFLGAGPGQLAGLGAVEGLDGAPGPAGPALEGWLEERLAREPAGVWAGRLTAAGIGAHPVVSMDELRDDPWVRAHGLIAERFHEGAGLVAQAGPALRMSATPVRIGRPAPLADADRDDVLAQLGRPA
jgi:crotonobetainyl-CoA:carnitine CoA-transferase CaiB-like acyl-CoA transferase